MEKFVDILIAAGIHSDPEVFDDFLRRHFPKVFGSEANVEDGLRLPRKMVAFCDQVRDHFNAPKLHDYDITGRLLNLRKQSRWSDPEPKKSRAD